MYGYTTICFDGTAADLARWRARMADALATATRFTIGCWNEEADAIALALRHGVIKPGDWAYGKYITGAVTDAFRGMLLTQSQPAEEKQLTPFFSVELDNGVSVSHWGVRSKRSGEDGAVPCTGAAGGRVCL